MSASVSFKELVNLAIGSPEIGAVNFNALHSLLHGLLEHLQLGEVRRDLSHEEREFIKPVVATGAASAEGRRPSSVFHQLQEKVARMEDRLLQLDSLPSSASLLMASQSQNKPVEEMWQMMQLKKKLEMNEDGVNKAINDFQELLSTFNSLKHTTDLIQKNLGALSDMVAGINIHEIQRRLQDLEGRAQNMPVLAEQLENLEKKLLSYPEPSEMVTWSLLHDAVTTSDWNLDGDAKQRNAKNILSSLGKLPGRHDEMEARVGGIEEELRRLGREIGKVEIPEDLLQRLRSLREDVERIFADNKKDKDEMKSLENALHQLNAALQRLDSKAAKLEADLAETATLQSQIYDLDKKKLDREELTLELSNKADKWSLDTKVGHSELESAVSDLDAVLQDLIKKLGAQEGEWRSILEKLLASLEAKLSRSDLDSIHRDLEELWRILKKHMSSGQAFDPDGAAGFRKKLFEKVKCISCDRPVTMATGPHLVTVRTASLLPRNRPNSADFSRDKSPGEPLQTTDPEFQYSEPPRPHTSCSHPKRASRTQHLMTVYPYGDPGHIMYRNTEFDLQGIDGVMYKGRMDTAFRNQPPERDPSMVVTPQPPPRLSMERARSASSHQRRNGSPISSSTHSIHTKRSSLHVPMATETPIFLQRPQSSPEERADP
ncbi:uncharacterized protein C16orf96 homolog isoform X2 [Spea bombifrons]|uniref:uncharacterized protein C16orf96 homolog isoform X2 n=1 Tax=Spea bombifrons TaxID=233779 RepID=UPI002349E99B|nr:uncharacterized protein C16orf96 homolog isoform X2 [Spea bombifrons]